jgi:hypothetical protein
LSLSRYRDWTNYPEVWVMPRLAWDTLQGKVITLNSSA